MFSMSFKSKTHNRLEIGYPHDRFIVKLRASIDIIVLLI